MCFIFVMLYFKRIQVLFGLNQPTLGRCPAKLLLVNSKSQQPKIDSYCFSLWDTWSPFSEAPQNIRSKLFVVSHSFLLSNWLAHIRSEKKGKNTSLSSRWRYWWDVHRVDGCIKKWCTFVAHTCKFNLFFSLHVLSSLPKLFIWRRTPSIARRRRHFRHTWQPKMMARSRGGFSTSTFQRMPSKP